MIEMREFRPGNFLMHKQQHRIVTVPLGADQLLLMARGELKDLHPVVLKPEWFTRCGFIENEDYPLRPGAREFMLPLPVPGSQQNEIRGWVKTNGECFARAVTNNLPVSANVFQLHNLQNLYFSLTGKELEISSK